MQQGSEGEEEADVGAALQGEEREDDDLSDEEYDAVLAEMLAAGVEEEEAQFVYATMLDDLRKDKKRRTWAEGRELKAANKRDRGYLRTRGASSDRTKSPRPRRSIEDLKKRLPSVEIVARSAIGTVSARSRIDPSHRIVPPER